MATLAAAMDLHLLFSWIWILIGLGTGVALGALFARDDWLGGYASWPRRLVRLGHISFVGTGLLNVAAHWTLTQMPPAPAAATAVRWAFVAGAVLMPAVCFLAAFAPRCRLLFAAPVVALGGGAAALVFGVPVTR